MVSPHNPLDDPRRRATIEPKTRRGTVRRRIGMVYRPPQNWAMHIVQHVVTALSTLESTQANL
eukprot:1807042-Pyramimonas_sp.AAC.1